MIELLLATSALAGLAVGLVGPLWLVAMTTVAVAGIAAFITSSRGYGAWGGIAFTTGCLIACQLCYMAGRFVARQYGFPDLSAQDEIDGEPGNPRQRGIADDDRENRKPPTRTPPPQP
jgi:hypothetical protein